MCKRHMRSLSQKGPDSTIDFHLRTHAGSLEVSRKRPCCRTVRTQYKRVGAPRRAPQQTSGGCSGPAAATAARTQLRLQLQTFGEAVAFCVARTAAAAATLLSPPPARCRAPHCAVVPVGAVPPLSCPRTLQGGRAAVLCFAVGWLMGVHVQELVAIKREGGAQREGAWM